MEQEAVEDKTFQLLPREHVSELAKHAIENVPDPYNPYTHFGSMAVVETIGGERHSGIIIENASLMLTKHPEEVAIVQAIMDGAIDLYGQKFISVIYLATFTGDAAPCGPCRQFISEFANTETIWVGHNIKTTEVRISHFKDLMPLPFKPAELL